MKKLMIILAAIAMAASVNAANVMWSAANVFEMGSSTTKATGYTAFFLSTVDMFNGETQLVKGYSLEAATASLAAGDISFLETYATSSKALSNGSGAATATTQASNGQSWTGYLVILDGTLESAEYAYITSTATKATGATGGQATLMFASNPGTQTAGNWYAVPEPTSGLLMLVGLAGLALRRRRA